MRCIWTVLLAVLIGSVPASAAEYFVRPDGGGDFPAIQAAIGASVSGDTVSLGNGVFRGAGNRDLVFGGKNLLLRSQAGIADSCTVDCEQAGRAMSFSGGEDSTCVIRGVTMRNGVSPLNLGGGGAVLINSGSSPRFQGCAFVSNICNRLIGGGHAVQCDNAAACFDSCLFLENGPEQYGAGGGTVQCSGSNVRFLACRFTGNSAGGSLGGGVYSTSGNLEFVNCTLSENSAYAGGGVYSTSGNLEFVNCTLSENVASSYGGGVVSSSGTVTFVSCVVSRNSCGPGQGGGLWASGSSVNIEGCTFAGNVGWDSDCFLYACNTAIFDNSIFCPGNSFGARAIECDLSAPAFHCCNIYNTSGPDWCDDFADQLGQNGNIRANPMFCDPASGDFRLFSASPCAPNDNPTCGLIGALPVGCLTSSTPTPRVPGAFALQEPVPHPVRSGSTLRFDLPEPGRATLRLYDVSGRLLARLQDGDFAAGSHAYAWSGAGDDGRPLPAGIYFCRLEAYGRTLTRRLVIAP